MWVCKCFIDAAAAAAASGMHKWTDTLGIVTRREERAAQKGVGPSMGAFELLLKDENIPSPGFKNEKAL